MLWRWPGDDHAEIVGVTSVPPVTRGAEVVGCLRCGCYRPPSFLRRVRVGYVSVPSSVPVRMLLCVRCLAELGVAQASSHSGG